jgi:membrane-bound metal-dependent hydrolase YbcI (DUF457 family)
MAQAGIHSIVGMAVRKWIPNRKWLMLGVVLGNLLPDADNLAVAIATLAGRPTEGLHRTFTHSLFTIAAVVVAFCSFALITKRLHWGNGLEGASQRLLHNPGKVISYQQSIGLAAKRCTLTEE